MSFSRCLLLITCLALAGCRPGSQGVMDEQKEPYFLAAKKRIQEKDPKGAIEYFEKALDVNPRSAAAHAELGMLYEKEDPADFAAALYHYKRALDIRADMPSADLYKMRMEDCKRELAKSVVQLPTMEAMQQKLNSLTAENQLLNMKLLAANRGMPYSNPPAIVAPSNPPPSRVPNPPVNPVRNEIVPAIRSGAGALPPLPVGRSTRIHTVASGETLGLIARRYNVKLPALQSANPTVDARRLRPGQILVIPSPQ